MGLWKSIKKGVGKIGDVAKYAAPLVAATGFGTPLAIAAMGLGGGLAGQLNNKNPSLKKGLLEGAVSGGTAYGSGALGDYIRGRSGGGTTTPSGANPLAYSGLSSLDKWGLGLGLAGTAAGAYGDYSAGKGADADRELARKQWEAEFGRSGEQWDKEFGRQTGLDTEDTRRWDTEFGEGTRRWDLDFGEDTRRFNENMGFDRERFGEDTRRYNQDFTEDTRRWDTSRADTRGDIEWERDLMKRKGTAMAPLLGSYLSRRY